LKLVHPSRTVQLRSIGIVSRMLCDEYRAVNLAQSPVCDSS